MPHHIQSIVTVSKATWMALFGTPSGQSYLMIWFLDVLQRGEAAFMAMADLSGDWVDTVANMGKIGGAFVVLINVLKLIPFAKVATIARWLARKISPAVSAKIEEALKEKPTQEEVKKRIEDANSNIGKDD